MTHAKQQKEKDTVDRLSDAYRDAGLRELTAAERLRQHVASRETEIVDVLAPSGFIYKFKKPSKFGLLFNLGSLPQTASSQAVASWQQDGIVPDDDAGEAQLPVIKTVLEMRDRVLELSYDPKLVIGKPENANEVSTDEVPDEDLEYLFKWVSAGGDKSAMLTTFPTGSQPSPLASASKPKQRVKAE